MKKIIAITAIAIIAVAILFSVSTDLTAKVKSLNNSPAYASVIPLPPPPPRKPIGC